MTDCKKERKMRVPADTLMAAHIGLSLYLEETKIPKDILLLIRKFQMQAEDWLSVAGMTDGKYWIDLRLKRKIKEIGWRIRAIRLAYKMNQGDFAAKLGVTRPHISYLESGKGHPTSLIIKAICSIFDIPEEWLRDGKIKGE